ncbi:hypothetical protein IAU60_000889 [Kwoniella sp. DSM 27419]
MPKANKGGKPHKNKVYSLPVTQKKQNLGIPKFQALAAKQKAKIGEGSTARPTPASLATLTAADQYGVNATGAGMGGIQFYEPIDASLTTRDSSSKAFMRELRKVIERSDVIIQVLDARDPEGTRSRWVEDEVRKRDFQGKKLLAVVNKIDLVPRANLEAWLKYLRHSFPTMPFKSSTQSQRNHLSQNSVPLAQPSAVPGQQVNLPALPTTSSSLGAPALLHLLKQYALSTPHSALTVGVVGYPNVGKSSLINSLKRSRACAVAAMPGKTRLVQEVVLDKGVKILDCPGVVLEDIGREMEGDIGKRRQAEIMLRNCVKAELVEDPVSPVEVILSKVDPAQLQKLYNIPPYDDIRDFLIKIALTRGRLGKGGIPDLEGSAVSVLRDWNSGKILYHTIPPAVHPSSAPAVKSAVPTNGVPADDVEMAGAQVGDAQILNTLSEAFTLDGLFDNFGDEAAWVGEDAAEDGFVADDVAEPELEAPAPTAAPVYTAPSFYPDSDDESDDFRMPAARPVAAAPAVAAQPLPVVYARQPAVQSTKLFTPDELAVLPEGVLDRQKAKQAAKKAKKRRAAAERTEGELMLGFMGMDVEEPEANLEEIDDGVIAGVGTVQSRKSKKEKKKVKKAQEAAQRRAGADADGGMDMDDDQKKEADFANFLANMGADSDEEL